MGAITSIAGKFGCASETLRQWVRRAEREARPPRQLMVAFIDAHRGRTESSRSAQCCRSLRRPTTRPKACDSDPTRRSARAHRDARLRPKIDRVWRANRRVYGAKKVWKQLTREGIVVARCTVERLMRADGLRGVVRGPRVRTTIPDSLAERPQDLVERAFHAERPNQLWVADFTYVATWRGMVYVAFVTDVFSWRIVGWRASASVRTDLALDALEQPVYDRETDAGLMHHSHRGGQYLSISYTERLAAGIEASVGSRGDAYDNALAESIVGRYKTEVIGHVGPWRSVDDVEYTTREWVAWFNTCRLLEPLRYVPPAEYEAEFAALHPTPWGVEHSTNRVSDKPGAIQTTFWLHYTSSSPVY